jgi:hypothetical protein
MRGRLSPSAAIAVLALFVALGGSSYAAVKVTGKDIRNGTVSSADIRDRSLRPRDFKPGVLRQGPVGPVGPTGLRGPAGPAGAGLTGMQRVIVTQPAGTLTAVSATAQCPAGKFAISGGAEVEPFSAPVAVSDVGPGGGSGDHAPGWWARAAETAPYAGDWKLTAVAVCVDG